MKNFKIVMASLLLVVGAVAFSSFKSDNYNKKAFQQHCFTYDATQGDIDEPTAWTEEDVTTPCTTTGQLCGICFFDTENGYGVDGSTGAPNSNVISALSGIKSNLPSSNATVYGSTDITIYQKAAR
jgi:hypothetical protein